MYEEFFLKEINMRDYEEEDFREDYEEEEESLENEYNDEGVYVNP